MKTAELVVDALKNRTNALKTAEAAVSRPSFLDRFFEISARGSTVGTEVRGGLSTFMVMAYIIFVNPIILTTTMGGQFFEPLVAVTCLTAGLLTLVGYGLYARYPFAMAPGMGLNAFVAFTLIGGLKLPWQRAMGVIFWEGVIITVLVLLGLRKLIVKSIPQDLRYAIGVGIGAFLAFIGFVNAGFVQTGAGTPVTLGNWLNWDTFVALFGLVLTGVLWTRKVKGSLLIGIIASTILAILVKQVNPKAFVTINLAGVAQRPLSFPNFSTFGQVDIVGSLGLGLLAVILAVMLSDFFDTVGTVIGIGAEAGFLNDKGEWHREKDFQKILLVDSVGPVLGGVAGASSNTTYIESAAGVAEGARTGLASVVTGLIFLAALFIAPLAGLVPSAATAPALIFVGLLMMSVIKYIDFSEKNAIGAIAAFVTILFMPFTYSISDGIAFGFVTYTLLSVLSGRARQVHPVMYGLTLVFVLYLFLFYRIAG